MELDIEAAESGHKRRSWGDEREKNKRASSRKFACLDFISSVIHMH
jgi:hypothetical protein